MSAAALHRICLIVYAMLYEKLCFIKQVAQRAAIANLAANHKNILSI